MKITGHYFDGVIFDMDGLILDNGISYKTAYQNAASEQKCYLSDKLYGQLLGLPHAECDRILQETFGEQFSVEAFTQGWQRQYKENLKTNGVQFRDGFEALFSHLKTLGVTIGLATSSTWDYVELHLAQTPYLQGFDVICTANDIHKGKPDPEIYIKTADRMKHQPNQLLVFEDANSGMRAATAAGCKAIMVPNQALPEEDVKEKAFLILSSLRDAISLIY